MIFSIEQDIQNQRRQEGPKSELFAPLAHPVNPKPHTAIYKMHRYFARRRPSPPFSPYSGLLWAAFAISPQPILSRNM